MKYWTDGITSVDEEWERAYNRFETRSEEIKKFEKRFRKFKFKSYPRSSRILDLFCGKGNALEALSNLGFKNLSGVDLSPELLKQCRVDAELYVGDGRDLKLDDECIDIVVIQGGLHHLYKLREDLPIILTEIARVLVPDGKVVITEPWLTPFLSMVHSLLKFKILRRVWAKFDALAIMIELEYPVYDKWLENKVFIKDQLARFFEIEMISEQMGKLNFIGIKPTL